MTLAEAAARAPGGAGLPWAPLGLPSRGLPLWESSPGVLSPRLQGTVSGPRGRGPRGDAWFRPLVG
eukprot:1343983-Pyramimonas_sp.AAC.1